MLTGDLRNQVDKIWDTFWTGGISNPLSVMEQMSYLLFIKRLDELHTKREKKANTLGKEMEDPIFGPDQQHMRWSNFRELDAESMFEVVRDEVFPFIKTIKMNGSGEATTYNKHMEDAVFLIPKPSLLANVVDKLDDIPMEDRDTKGDLYEYMLSKIQSSGENGQFRTPRHIINMMVHMVKPEPEDTICDPACGTAGFLISAADYLRENHEKAFYDKEFQKRFNNGLFNGFDFDNTMLRIGSMNMMLHGIENANIAYRDSLSEESANHEEEYSLILANPPFKGSLDYESAASNLVSTIGASKTSKPKTELLFLALFIRLLKSGGRCAVIVPDGVLFNNNNTFKNVRKMLVEEQKLEAVISMPSGVFKPYAGVSTAILVFTKTNSGGTDKVWFYDMKADGKSLDDNRDELTPNPFHTDDWTEIDHEKNNIPDILRRWENLEDEKDRARTDQSFFVRKEDISTESYNLSLNQYKEVEYQEIEYDEPSIIITDLKRLNKEIETGVAEIEEII
jgi:type I restriction enzyme M protein